MKPTRRTRPTRLGEVLRLAREMKGETLRSLEKQTGLSNALISQIETGHIRSPSFEAVVRLARALNVPLKHFEQTVHEWKDLVSR